MDSIISIPLAAMNGQRVPAPKASTVLPVLERMAAQQGSRGQGWQEASVAVEEEGLGIQEFWAKYQEPNRPVIVKGATKGWRASKEWVVTDESGRRMPNFSLLKQLFGDDEVCAARCAEKHFSDQKREEMRMRDFLDCWQAGRRRDELLYVKDWHFARLHRDYNAYECPEIFSEDWLNRWYDARDDADDYRFCYMGREGTWTPLHRDVLRSYRWVTMMMTPKVYFTLSPCTAMHGFRASIKWMMQRRDDDVLRYYSCTHACVICSPSFSRNLLRFPLHGSRTGDHTKYKRGADNLRAKGTH
jgi:hypothetical protein